MSDDADITSAQNEDGYLSGQMLIAMPTMADPRFQRTVLYICAHSSDGAMGIVVNRVFASVSFHELLEQLGIDSSHNFDHQVHFGGPVETGRGFLLHSTDVVQAETVMVRGGIGLTGTLDILRTIANGNGPKQSLFALGYAGWGPGQLEAEIRRNGWLSVPLNTTVLFDDDLETKWERALGHYGIDPLMLSDTAGTA